MGVQTDAGFELARCGEHAPSYRTGSGGEMRFPAALLKSRW